MSDKQPQPQVPQVKNRPSAMRIETNSKHGKMQIRDTQTGRFVKKK